MNLDVQTDEHGRPKVTPELVWERALEQGRVHEGEKQFWTRALREHPDAAGEWLLARRPLGVGAGRQMSEAAFYDTYARMTGVRR